MTQSDRPILFVLLNGPPGSGKTTLKRMLVQHFENYCIRVISDSFAGPIKSFISTCLSMKYQEIEKDKFHPVLNMTPRQFLMTLSENFMKPNLGVNIYGALLVQRAYNRNPWPQVVVVDDLGFEVETQDPWPNVIIRVQRQGCTFEGDSRDYVAGHRFTVTNDESIKNLNEKAKTMAQIIISGMLKDKSNVTEV